MDERIQKYEEKMKKTLVSLEGELATIRAGRANPHILDKLTVDYYGAPTPLQQVANITVPEARMIQIQPWESSLIKGIEKAILTSDLGLNPSNDGKVIRLVFPELTEERRKELVKDVKKKGEGAKVAVRNIRRDANDAYKKLAKQDVSEDEIKELEDKIQKSTDKYIKEVDAAVTMHFPFPIGVSTVGRCVTPAQGKEMYIANTTGTSSTDRIEGMIKNAVYGIITAKACGNANPTVGILNVDGARQTEKALKQLKDQGYDIAFAESGRADGGCVMRGNDVLQASPDIMVTDSLTGNILVKMLSSANTGGSFEATGYGYGPGIGEGYEQLVMIVSRASGAPVIANAIRYAAQLVRGKVFEVTKAEFAAVKKAGFDEILNGVKAASKPAAAEEDVKEPPKEIVTAQIPGIEVMDLEDAVKVLWKINIYAESGMGCTGPIIRVSDANLAKAEEELKKAGYIN